MSSTSQDGAVLRVEDVTLRFGGVVALDAVSIELRAGEIHGVIGPNGAGKSSLLDVLSGLTQQTSGRVFLDGADISSTRAVQRARQGVRRTFQRQQLFGWLSVEDNLLVSLEWRGGGGGILADIVGLPSRRARERERRERVAELLELFSLERVRHQPAGVVPIGTARLIEIARAFIDRPRVVLMDEPTSGLDVHETAEVGEIVARAVANDDCAVALVEHDVPFVMRHCSVVTVLHLGKVLAYGLAEEVRELATVQDAYLGGAIEDFEEHLA